MRVTLIVEPRSRSGVSEEADYSSGLRRSIILGLLVGAMIFAPGDDPKAHPELPDTLSNESVREYASEYERTEVYRERDPSDDVRFHVSCPATIDLVTDAGHYAVTQCWGGFTNERTGESGHFSTTRQYYLINETATVRIPTDTIHSDSGEPSRIGSYYIVNFGGEPRTLSVQLQPVEGNTSATPIEYTHEMAARDGKKQIRVANSGEYILSVTTDRGDTVRYRWNITEDVATRTVPTIYVKQNGEVTIHPTKSPDEPTNEPEPAAPV